jgi:hypothetical protein
VRDRPTRIARDEAEPLLQVEPIDLVDHAVDVVVERGALRLDVVVEGKQVLDRRADLHQRIGREAAVGEPFEHTGLARRRQRAHLPPAIGEEAERARGGDGGVELAQRASRRVAGIGEDLPSGRLLPIVEREKGGLRHVYLAPHLAALRHAPAGEPLRDVFERLHVGGHILTFAAVATRRGAHQLPAFVEQRAGQAVDLGLGGECDLLVLRQAQKAAYAFDEFDDFLVGKGVAEREHRHRVAHLGEFL